jgi:hypothetical protein
LDCSGLRDLQRQAEIGVDLSLSLQVVPSLFAEHLGQIEHAPQPVYLLFDRPCLTLALHVLHASGQRGTQTCGSADSADGECVNIEVRVRSADGHACSPLLCVLISNV